MKKELKKLILKPMDMLYKISPKFELKLMFFLKNGYIYNERKPKTYNEKLNWMKINYRNENMIQCADKYTVRSYIEEKGFGYHLPEILWQGFDPNEIPFDHLPKKFVIKTTHGAGNNIICTNKNALNKKQVIKKMSKWLKEEYLICYGEWFYGKVQPRIIIEEFLSNNGHTSPIDYKFYCFNDIDGKNDVGIIAVHEGRGEGQLTKTIYTQEWNALDVVFGFEPNLRNKVKKPERLEEMIEISKVLSEEFPHARIDFYVVNNKIYIGEITFMTGAGFNKIYPRSFDLQLGDWIKLPID